MRKFALIRPTPPTPKEIEMATEQYVELIHVGNRAPFSLTFKRCDELIKEGGFAGIVCTDAYTALCFICQCDVGVFQYSDNASKSGLRIFSAHTIVIEKSSYKPF